jgi:hypothetical protein
MDEVVEKTPDIYTYILQEEAAWRTERVPLASNWRDWNMFEHIDRSYTLKNSRFYQGAQDYRRPFNNVILPIANVNYRTEGFDVKDVQLYVDNAENYHKSFVARKFHGWWAKANKINTAIDETVVSYFDYGLTVVKNVNEARPEVIQLQQIAFCDQTDFMAGPQCLKHNYSISELLDMKGRWKDSEIDKAILMSRFSKAVDGADGEQVQTPGKYVEVYELHGTFPESWLGPEKLGEGWEDTGKYSPQIHIVTYYVDSDGHTKNGITLFKGKEPNPVFKALKRDDVYGRACGRGGIEELFHPQIWTNYSELHISKMLEAVSKVVLKTNKKKVTQLNNLSNIKDGQIIDLDGDGTLEQLQMQPLNKGAFDNYVNKWEQIARTIGSASDPQLGLNPTSGTPLGTTEIVTTQGVGIHDYRQGQIAEFWQEIYRDWVLPHLQREINKGSKWLDELTLDEMQDIVEKVTTKEANKKIKEKIKKGDIPTKEETEQFKAVYKEIFMNQGSKRFFEAAKDEYKSLPMDVEVSISNKQRNAAEMVSKLNSVFRTLFTPGAVQVLQSNKGVADLFNQILEASALSPVNFGAVTAQQQQIQQQLPTPSPVAQQPQVVS